MGFVGLFWVEQCQATSRVWASDKAILILSYSRILETGNNQVAPTYVLFQAISYIEWQLFVSILFVNRPFWTCFNVQVYDKLSEILNYK